MANYNLTRYVEDLLKNTEALPPSFTVHLKNTHWCLNNFNAGAKFAYNHQVASLLDDIRAQRIPVDLLELFDSEKVPFYEGCLLVELRDYRPRDNVDDFISSRVVLQPNPETLWADICQLNHKMGNKWSDQEALEVEARILMATAPPLCLDPDPHLVRAANSTLRVSVPTAPASLKRKASAMDPEETAFEKVRRAKIMQFMRPTNNKPQNWRVLEAIQRKKLGITASIPTPLSQPASASSTQQSSQQTPHQPPSASTTPAPSSVPPVYEDQKGAANGLPSVSPVNGRVPTPVSQSRLTPLPYPQHSPPPPSRSPPKPVSVSRQPSADPHKKSASPQGQPQPTQPNPQQPQQSVQPPPASHPQYPMTAFQPTMPPHLQQQSFGKKKGGPPTQQQPSQAQMQMYAFQHAQFQQAQQAAAHRFNQNTQQPQAAAATGASTATTVRSPMVQNATQQTTPQPQHPQQPTTQQQHAYTLALQQQTQYTVARMQAQVAGHPPPPMPPLLAAHLAAQQAHAQANNAQAQSNVQSTTPSSTQPSQDPAPTHPMQMIPGYPHMYNYAQMQSGRMAQAYPGYYGTAMGYRRAMTVNGQPQMPTAANASGHSQQVPVARAMPGGVQGR